MFACHLTSPQGPFLTELVILTASSFPALKGKETRLLSQTATAAHVQASKTAGRRNEMT